MPDTAKGIDAYAGKTYSRVVSITGAVSACEKRSRRHRSCLGLPIVRERYPSAHHVSAVIFSRKNKRFSLTLYANKLQHFMADIVYLLTGSHTGTPRSERHEKSSA
jgi:hypothetical protein